jgi:hypothetical protein
MQLDPKVVLDLVQNIDSEDPVDWGMLEVNEQAATELVVLNILDQYSESWSKLAEPDRSYAIVAMVAKLVLENFALNLKLINRET